jgi:hypothetical protein
MFHHIT